MCISRQGSLPYGTARARSVCKHTLYLGIKDLEEKGLLKEQPLVKKATAPKTENVIFFILEPLNLVFSSFINLLANCIPKALNSF